jgi:AGCS family alanine or glycine:cation symporter
MGLPTWISGTVLVLITLPVIVRGTKGVSSLTELLVPIMTLGYLVLSAAVLILRREAVGAVFLSIFRDAFSTASVGGGILGFLTSRAIQSGTMRGLLSNEAGCGTAPTAHATAQAKSPAAQGVWGIFEVFVDTILLCTVTALVVLVSFDEVRGVGADGVMMTIRAYSTVLGGWAEWFFAAAILAFGYATLICWASYGLECLRFLTPRRSFRYLYFFVFGAAILIGAVVAPESVWTLTDVSVTLLTLINLSALLLLRREIKKETEAFCGVFLKKGHTPQKLSRK